VLPESRCDSNIHSTAVLQTCLSECRLRRPFHKVTAVSASRSVEKPYLASISLAFLAKLKINDFTNVKIGRSNKR